MEGIFVNFDYAGIFGFDISKWQDDPTTPQKNNFQKMKDYGASFAISKAGQYNFQDISFSDNWKRSKENGLSRGSYWFCDSRSDGKSQAQKYWEILLKNGYDGEICFADYEGGAWNTWKELYNFIYEFQRISNIPSHKIGIYTGYYFWLENMPKADSERIFFKKFPLWLAYYTEDVTFVKVPKPWSEEELILWQSGTPAIGEEAGVESREIDYNKFQGNSERFFKYFGKPEEIAPSPEIPSQKKEPRKLTIDCENKRISYKEKV